MGSRSSSRLAAHSAKRSHSQMATDDVAGSTRKRRCTGRSRMDARPELQRSRRPSCSSLAASRGAKQGCLLGQPSQTLRPRTKGQRLGHGSPIALQGSSAVPQGGSRQLSGRKQSSLAASQGERRFTLPSELRSYMATWGPELRRAIEAEASRRGLGLPRTCLRVGTDCSGLDAPIFALRRVQLPHGIQHEFSCESSEKKRAFLEANHPGALILKDMLQRDHAALPDVDIYVCGFPCKPFSRLHVGSKGFAERAARPFREMVRTISTKLPPIAVLENVGGLRSHLARVHRVLRRIGWYEVLTVMIDPYEMGEPMRRQRFYFLLIRVDVAVATGGALDEHAKALMAVGLRSERASPAQRMLASSAPEVVEYIRRAQAKQQHKASGPIAASQGQAKWKAQHRGRARQTLQRPVLGLTAREQEVLGIKLADAGFRDLTARTNVDTSQSCRFARCTEYVPTVTPGSRIVVGQLRRIAIPIEKCLLNAIPVHEVRWPACLTDQDIADLGGNTMHLVAVDTTTRRAK